MVSGAPLAATKFLPEMVLIWEIVEDLLRADENWKRRKIFIFSDLPLPFYFLFQQYHEYQHSNELLLM